MAFLIVVKLMPAEKYTGCSSEGDEKKLAQKHEGGDQNTFEDTHVFASAIEKTGFAALYPGVADEL